MSCTGLNALNPICQVQSIPEELASDAFSQIAGWFGAAASAAANGLWNEVGSATTIDLDSPQLASDLVATSAIAAVLCLGLFTVQVITSVLRREPGGLARAVKGLFVAVVASVFALTATKLLLGAVDALSNGVVRYAMDTNMEGLGRQLALANIGAPVASHNPAVLLLVSIVILAAVVVIWAAMMIRKLMIIIAAVMAPLAFSGATADITRGWVRRWVEFMAAMIASKLLLVIILMIGVSVLEGAGNDPHAGAGQDLTQLATGALILLMGGFAPWIAIKMFHFAGDTLQSAHAYAAQAPSGARSVIAAPQKVNAMHSQASSAVSKMKASGRGVGGATPKTTSELLTQKFGHPGAMQPQLRHQSGAGGLTTRHAGAGAAASGMPPAAAAAPVALGAGTLAAAGKAGQGVGDATEHASPSPPAQPPPQPPDRRPSKPTRPPRPHDEGDRDP